ncbi:putative K domain-containing protein [Arabidopsis thaliana]
MEGKKFGAQSTARAPLPLPQPPSAPPPEYVTFRILCNVSQAGHVIGKHGGMVKKLHKSTESSIWVEKTPLDDSTYRIIKIFGHVGSVSRVKLGVIVNNVSNREKKEQEQEVEVSRAQYALIRVFEALNFGDCTSSTVSCNLLMEGSHVVTVIGKNGELMQRILEETGCNVQLRSHDLSICTNPGDVVLKIEGNRLSAVMKALVSISSRLQACPPISTASLHAEAVPDALRRPMEYRSQQYREVDPHGSLHRHVEISQEDALVRPFFRTITQPRIDYLPHPSYDHRLITSASKNPPVTIKQPLQASKDDIRQVDLKILCSNESASVVIKTRSVTDASISVGDRHPDCDERLVTITAFEKTKDITSESQRALVLVFSNMYENATAKVLDSGVTSSITARLVVRSNQINCLLGEEGRIKTTIQQRTGAFITVLNVEQNPKCVSENNQVVQISGEFPNVREAINQVTSMLREDLINQSFQRGSQYAVNYSEDPFPELFSPTAGYTPTLVGLPLWILMISSITLVKLHLGCGNHRYPPAAPRSVNDGSGGLFSTRDDLVLTSGLKTVRYRVSEYDVCSMFGYGKDGHNRLLKSLREVIVHIYILFT